MNLKKALKFIRKFTDEEWKEIMRKEKEKAKKDWEEFKKDLPKV